MQLRLAAALLALGAPVLVLRAQPPSPIDAVVNAMTFRNIGPLRTSAWVTEVAVPETPLHDTGSARRA